MKLWRASLVAAVMAGAVGFGCGGVEPAQDSASGATERYVQELEDANNQCGKKQCFDIERDKNITHIFLDFGKCPVKDLDVKVWTESRGWEDVTDRLKTKGGPCKDLEPEPDYRFELPGPDKFAKVCVTTHDYATKVRVGAKSGNECSYENYVNHEPYCKKCKDKY